MMGLTPSSSRPNNPANLFYGSQSVRNAPVTKLSGSGDGPEGKSVLLVPDGLD